MTEDTALAEVAKLLPTQAAQFLVDMDDEIASTKALTALRKLLVELEQANQPLNPIQFDIVVNQVITSAANAAVIYQAYEILYETVSETTKVMTNVSSILKENS